MVKLLFAGSIKILEAALSNSFRIKRGANTNLTFTKLPEYKTIEALYNEGKVSNLIVAKKYRSIPGVSHYIRNLGL